MKIRIIITSVLMCIFTCAGSVFAETDAITCTTEIEGRNVSISGQVPDVTAPTKVSIWIGESSNAVYVNQTTSTATGEFSFDFEFLETIESGTYNFTINSDNGTASYKGTLSYTAPLITERNKFIEMNLNVTISGYMPTLTGTVSCTEGKTVEYTITNTTDNTVIASETITSEDGTVNISQPLPSLLNPKEYSVSARCFEGENTLLNMSVAVDSAVLFVEMNGAVNTAENVDVEGSLSGYDIGLVDTSINFAGSKEISVSIPNIAANTEVGVIIICYETVIVSPNQPTDPDTPTEPEPPTDPDEPTAPDTPVTPGISEYTYTVNGTAGENFNVITTANNIKSFDDKIYTIEYNDEQIEIVSVFGTEYVNVVGTGIKNDVNILSCEPGIITFTKEGVEIPENSEWSGILNVFKFKFRSNYSGESSIKISN